MPSHVDKFARNLILLAYSFIAKAGSVQIEKLVVPEVVQTDSLSGVILDCLYSGTSDQLTVQWFFNNSDVPVYEWKPRMEPRLRGLMEGRLDLSYRPSSSVGEERRALRIVSLEPELSGDYTCRVLDKGLEARQTKSMLVFSPERDFTLEFIRQGSDVNVKCTVKGVYPSPEVFLERNGVMLPKQQLRLWRSEGRLYDAECVSELGACAGRSRAHITCRLQIPLAGYTAIKKELYLDKKCTKSSSNRGISIQLLFVLGLASTNILIYIH